MAARVPPPKHPGMTVGTVADEDGAAVWWFCDDMQNCRFLSQLDVPTLIENRGRDALIDDLIDPNAPCPQCGGLGHVRVMHKPDPVKERRAQGWWIAGLVAGAAFMFFGAFFNFDRMSSGESFRPFQLIVCIPLGLALLYFAWEIWKGMRTSSRKSEG